MKIVNTDNHGSDYPNESFLNLPPMMYRNARIIVDAINSQLCADDNAPRCWKVVDNDYELHPGFEP